MENVACDYCGHGASKVVYQVQDTNYGTPGVFTLVQCRDCGLVYLSPRPTLAELPERYPATRYAPFTAVYSADETTPSAIHSRRAAWVTQLCGPGTVLDVGCGDGRFLCAMREAGWHGAGVELHTPAARHARDKLGFDVRAGDIRTWPGEGQFDLITFWDVLEHTPSPSAALSHARRLLKPDGRLALSVPNWDSLERQCFGARWIALDAPRHFYHFSIRTLRAMVTKAGFRLERLTAVATPHSLASNCLRLAGDVAFRRGQAKALVGTGALPAPPGGPSPGHQRLIGLAHALAIIPNGLANALQRGADLTAIARAP